MILRVTNINEYAQTITLHTGESKEIAPGTSIRINTGSDRRLSSFYASLINYNFEVTCLEASGQEQNSFSDAVSRIKRMRDAANESKTFQDREVYPQAVEKPTSPRLESDVPDPKTVDGQRVENSPVPRITTPSSSKIPTRSQLAPEITYEVNPTVVDSKIGEVIPDFTQTIPDDYPDDPQAVAEVKRIEALEEKQKVDQESSDAKWYKLDELDEDTLKKVLKEEFGEDTRLRNKSKIIYHIIDLADDAEVDVFDLVDKYQG